MAGKLSTGGGKRGPQVTADPNVIPFIDVMLVLLIIFMIAAPISSVDIEVDMPTSRIEPSKRPPRPTWVSVSQAAGGGIDLHVMNDPVSQETLGEETYQAVRENSPQIADDDFEVKDQRIYIRADGELEYRHIVRVMNRLQDRGFTKIGLVAEDRRR